MNGASALPVLMYHHVSPAPGLVTVSPETFRDQIKYLAEHGYSSVGCADLAAFLAGKPLAAKSVVITFDDGYLDNFVYAHPILQEFGFKAVLFLITGWLGDGALRPKSETPNHRTCMDRVKQDRKDDVMLRWSEVDAMAAAGTFEFHSHTDTHTRWDRSIANVSERRAHLLADLTTSRKRLSERLGTASDHLCWPQGYYDDDYIDVAREAGFRYLYTVEKGTVTPGLDLLRIPRVVVKDRGEAWFGRRLSVYRRAWLGGLYTWLRGK